MTGVSSGRGADPDAPIGWRGPVVRARREARLAAAIAVAALAGSGLSCGRAGDGSSPPPPADVSLRVIAPGELAGIVEAEKGKVVLVDFWATWCLPCIREFPHTVRLHRTLGPKGLSVIAMSLDDPSEKERVLAFLRERGATFPNFLSAAGGGSASAEAFGIEGVPHYRIYDRGGRIAREFSVDPSAPVQFKPEDIEAEILRLLEAKA